MADGVERSYVAFDLETTGLSPRSDRVIEFGAVRFDASGREQGRFERLVNPCCRISPGALAVHGIRESDLAGCSPPAEVVPEFLEFLGDPGDTTLLAHNAAFDTAFLWHEVALLGAASPRHEVVDTLALARRQWPKLRSHRLDALVGMLSLADEGGHRALADSLRVKALWLALRGPAQARTDLVAYGVGEASSLEPTPLGWDPIVEAITRGRRVRIEYQGGTRGGGLREVTPRRFVHRGGMAYLVAFCHFDATEKSFRLDRVRRYEVVQ